MYAIPMKVDLRLRTNADLRQYARMEYGHEDVSWILAEARRARQTAPRRPLRLRFLSRRQRPVHRPVACKGTPRRHPVEARAPG